MSRFETAKEKAAAQARLVQQKYAAAQERRAQDAHARSPIGQATAAHDRGDALLQVSVPVNDGTSQILNHIEEIGWKLEHVTCAFVVSGDSDNIGGELTGIYVFRPN